MDFGNKIAVVCQNPFYGALDKSWGISNNGNYVDVQTYKSRGYKHITFANYPPYLRLCLPKGCKIVSCSGVKVIFVLATETNQGRVYPVLSYTAGSQSNTDFFQIHTTESSGTAAYSFAANAVTSDITNLTTELFLYDCTLQLSDGSTMYVDHTGLGTGFVGNRVNLDNAWTGTTTKWHFFKLTESFNQLLLWEQHSMTSPTYTSDIWANGTNVQTVIANGTTLTRLRANNKDVLHKTNFVQQFTRMQYGLSSTDAAQQNIYLRVGFRYSSGGTNYAFTKSVTLDFPRKIHIKLPDNALMFAKSLRFRFIVEDGQGPGYAAYTGVDFVIENVEGLNEFDVTCERSGYHYTNTYEGNSVTDSVLVYRELFTEDAYIKFTGDFSLNLENHVQMWNRQSPLFSEGATVTWLTSNTTDLRDFYTWWNSGGCTEY